MTDNPNIPDPNDKSNVGFSFEPAITDNTPQFAGFWLRAVAFIADGVIIGLFQSFVVMPVLTLLGYEVTLDPNMLNNNQNLDSQLVMLLNYLVLLNGISFVLSWLYYVYLESSATQATLGKIMMGIKVTDTEGNKISFGKATVRFFSKILSGLILGIGYFMAGVTPKKQALHDIIAGTLVIMKPTETDNAEPV